MSHGKVKSYREIEQGASPDLKAYLLPSSAEKSSATPPTLSRNPSKRGGAPTASSAGNVKVLGLSYMHKGPQENERVALKGSLQVWEGGKSSHIKLQGTSKKGSAGEKRGVCKGFSKRSRRSMVFTIGKTDLEAMGIPVFWSGTYPGKFEPDWKVWKRDLKVFFKRILRKWPEAVVLWRLEPQKRGAPHFHFLIWKGPRGVIEEVASKVRNKKIYVMTKRHKENRDLFDWFSRSWAEVVGSDDPKHVMVGSRLEAIQTENGVLFYVSKYMTKEEKERGLAELEWGRPWGVMGRKNWDRHMEWTYSFSEDVFYRIRRVIKRYLEKKMGRKIRLYARNKGFRLGTLRTLDLMRCMSLFCYQESNQN